MAWGREEDEPWVYLLGRWRQTTVSSAVLPVIIHVLDLPFDKAVNALAVRAVREPTDDAEAVGPLLFGKQPLNRDHNPLPPLLMAAGTHHFLFQPHFRLDQRAVFCLPPSSLQGAGSEMRKRKGRERECKYVSVRQKTEEHSGSCPAAGRPTA